MMDEIYPLLIIREVVAFPRMVFSLSIFDNLSSNAVSLSLKGNKSIVVAAQTQEILDEEIESYIAVCPQIGTICKIIQVLKNAEGTYKLLLEAERRVIIDGVVNKHDTLIAKINELGEDIEASPDIKALLRTAITRMRHYARITSSLSDDALYYLEITEDPSKIADFIALNLKLKPYDQKVILETLDVKKRLEIALMHLENEITICNEEKSLRSKIKKRINNTRREIYLREQLRAIQTELGMEDENIPDEISALEKQVTTSNLPKEAQERVTGELKKLKMMAPISSEATVSRSYIEFLLSLPWKKKSKITKSINKAKLILDRDHFGLDKIKERILEFLAVQSRSGGAKGQIICLVGPPGVGKTSLAKSIAESTGRNYVKISLGGLKDEAEIRGHRRTYVGAMAGKIISAIKKAKTSNPLILLDEIDKIGADFRGDPEAALLEVLDPEQNSSFNDHYVDLDYNLSDVMFIATANSLEMSKPLLDRMEIIRLSGYTDEEKLEIAENYILEKELKYNGLKKHEFSINREAIMALIRNYTREAGVRNLGREISKLARKSVLEITKDKTNTVAIGIDNLEKYAGPPKYRYTELEQKSLVGITTGLAWTEVGGEILSIESLMLPGKGTVTCTGKLGDVMQESVKAAMSFARAKAVEYGIDSSIFEKNDFHIHVPEGATPKDGPSAGVAMVTSIMSSVTGIPVKRDTAMTGEVTLRGRILPIGGLKEKMLAAHRSLIKTVIIPKDNEKDLSEIPDNVVNELQIYPLDSVSEALDIALEKPILHSNIYHTS